MRKVVAALFISLDGVVESPGRWEFDAFDEDMATNMFSIIGERDALLLGRGTYQEWADYWPTATFDREIASFTANTPGHVVSAATFDRAFASFINDTPKYVVSTTLDSVAWANTTLLKGNLADEIAALKTQPGSTIGAAGSPTLVRSLIQQDLLDEFQLMVHPVIAGNGKRLFADGDDLKRLRLVDSKATRSGVALLTYRPLDKA
jgi:dihydrofolate reductase